MLVTEAPIGFPDYKELPGGSGGKERRGGGLIAATVRFIGYCGDSDIRCPCPREYPLPDNLSRLDLSQRPGTHRFGVRRDKPQLIGSPLRGRRDIQGIQMPFPPFFVPKQPCLRLLSL